VLSRKGKLPSPAIDAIEIVLRDQPIAPRPRQTLNLGLVDADLFVTGDQGVLACTRAPLPIVNPSGAWEQLRGPGSQPISRGPASRSSRCSSSGSSRTPIAMIQVFNDLLNTPVPRYGEGLPRRRT
jgi:hypothetical protein